jgi:predicted transcriptional regulator
MDVIAPQVESLKQQAQLADPDRLMRIAEVLSQAEDRMRYSLSRRTLVETSLIRCARATTVSVDDLIERLEALGQSAGGGGMIPSPIAGRVEAVRESPAPAYASRPQAPAPAARPNAPPVSKLAPVPVRWAASAPARNELDDLTAQWRDQIVERVKREVTMAGIALLDARPLAVEQNRVVIGFDPQFARKLEQIKIPTYHAAVQKIMVQFLKRPVNVECVLMTGDGAADVPADHTVDKVGAPKPSAGVPTHPKTRQDWHQEPVVRKTLEFFNGSIVDIRE